jgi:hypothetical protein
MSTTEAPIVPAAVNAGTGAPLVQYSVSDSAIAEMRDAYMPLAIAGAEDSDGFKRVHEARIRVKTTRVDIEKKRKELKEDALRWGRTVDGEAKRLTALLEPIESHLQTEEDGYTAAKEAIRNAERLKAEAEERAKREAEEARLKAEHDAEVERLRVEREKLDAERKEQERQLAAQRKALDEERAKVAAEQAAERARQKAEQDKIDAEARAIMAEKKRLADIEAARLRKIEEERIAAEASERARIETEARIAQEAAAAKAKEEATAAAKARAEALRPDAEKLAAVADAVANVEVPDVSSDAADSAQAVRIVIMQAAERIRTIVARMGADVW